MYTFLTVEHILVYCADFYIIRHSS